MLRNYTPVNFVLNRIVFDAICFRFVYFCLYFAADWDRRLKLYPWTNRQSFTPGEKPTHLPAIGGAHLFRAFLFCRKTVGCRRKSPTLLWASSFLLSFACFEIFWFVDGWFSSFTTVIRDWLVGRQRCRVEDKSKIK